MQNCSDILIMFETSLESELLSIKDCLVRKTAVTERKLEKDIFGDIEDIVVEAKIGLLRDEQLLLMER